MAIEPCCLCGQRYLGPSITGYHSWYTDNIRVGYKQRICTSCAKERLATYVRWGIDQTDPQAKFPETCPACGASLEQDVEPTYSTWYRGKQRKDLALFTCSTCAIKIRSVLETGGDRLENRSPGGGGGGRPPSPSNGEGPKNEDLPW